MIPEKQIVCGRRAGAHTVLVDSYNRHRPAGHGSNLHGDERPDFLVATMTDLLTCLEMNFELLHSNDDALSQSL